MLTTESNVMNVSTRDMNTITITKINIKNEIEDIMKSTKKMKRHTGQFKLNVPYVE